MYSTEGSLLVTDDITSFFALKVNLLEGLAVKYVADIIETVGCKSMLKTFA